MLNQNRITGCQTFSDKTDPVLMNAVSVCEWGRQLYTLDNVWPIQVYYNLPPYYAVGGDKLFVSVTTFGVGRVEFYLSYKAWSLVCGQDMDAPLSEDGVIKLLRLCALASISVWYMGFDYYIDTLTDPNFLLKAVWGANK